VAWLVQRGLAPNRAKQHMPANFAIANDANYLGIGALI